MDRRSWLWRRKSSEKSPGESESSGSLSSHSERFSDDQEASKASPNHAQSPEISSNISGGEVQDNVKSLTEKLSAALSNISAKEDLVMQHAKVAEEAVSGWENAESEVVALKQQLEAATQKNSGLEDRVGHIDGALKECVRQLRQAREEHEQKIHEALLKKSHEWESSKFILESQLTELQTQLQAAQAKLAAASVDHGLQLKLEAAEKENLALKHDLYVQAEELKVRTLERELSTRAAETASKQHLESIKKVAKLEAECRKLRAAARKASLTNDHRPIAANIYVESFTDSQSDSGERLLSVETDIHRMGGVESNEYEPSCSDSWASALIAELDQFKNDKVIGRNLTVASRDIDLMDDFLEMERLASLAEMGKDGRGSELAVITDRAYVNNGPSKSDIEAMLQKTAELEERVKKLEDEKAELEMALVERQDQLDTSQRLLTEAEQNLVELQRQLASVNMSKQAVDSELEASNGMRKVLESQFEAANVEVQTLQARVGSLELEVKNEKELSAEITTKCHKLEDELASKKHESELQQSVSSNGDLKIKQEKEFAVAAGKLAECQKTIASLGQQLKSLATFEDFLLDCDMPEQNGGTPIISELKKSYLNNTCFSKKEESSNTVDGFSPRNGQDRESPPSSSSSSSANHDSEKGRSGFRKLFSRSKNGSCHVENQ